LNFFGSNRLTEKLFLFLVAGASGFLLDSVVFFLLLYFIKLHFVWCRAIASLFAMVFTWKLNRNLAFKKQKSLSKPQELTRYILASLFGAFANLIIFAAVMPFDQKMYHLPSYVLGALGGLIVNYFLYDKLVFRYF
jgi:putative flippase GtrA